MSAIAELSRTRRAAEVEWLSPDPRDDPRLGTWDPRELSLDHLCMLWKTYQRSAKYGYIDLMHRAVVDEIVHRLEALSLTTP